MPFSSLGIRNEALIPPIGLMFSNQRFFATSVTKSDNVQEEPVKRPRGRPRKIVDPNEVVTPPVKKPRGRPRKIQLSVSEEPKENQKPNLQEKQGRVLDEMRKNETSDKGAQLVFMELQQRIIELEQQLIMQKEEHAAEKDALMVEQRKAASHFETRIEQLQKDH